MRNLFHLAVETPKPNLSVGMKYLQGTWANRFNRYLGQTEKAISGVIQGAAFGAGSRARPGCALHSFEPGPR
jgi:hypothetical protein